MTLKKLETHLVAGICPPLTIQHGYIQYYLDVRNTDNSVHPVSGGDNEHFIMGTWAELRCNGGRARTGSRRRNCQSNGEWDGEDTVCTGKDILIHQ